MQFLVWYPLFLVLMEYLLFPLCVSFTVISAAAIVRYWFALKASCKDNYRPVIDNL